MSQTTQAKRARRALLKRVAEQTMNGEGQRAVCLYCHYPVFSDAQGSFWQHAPLFFEDSYEFLHGHTWIDVPLSEEWFVENFRSECLRVVMLELIAIERRETIGDARMALDLLAPKIQKYKASPALQCHQCLNYQALDKTIEKTLDPPLYGVLLRQQYTKLHFCSEQCAAEFDQYMEDALEEAKEEPKEDADV